jgi:glucose-6-phosphate isomerase
MKFIYQKTSGISSQKILKASKKLESYFKRLQKIANDFSYLENESTIALPRDKELQKISEQITFEYLKKDIQELIIIGIGGSNLGAMAVYSALNPKKGVKLSFVDTLNSRNIKETIARMKSAQKFKKHVVLNIISKSGSTTETISNSKIFIEELKKVSKHWNEYIVVTTEPKSKLCVWAETHAIDVLPNPEKVGGRYSVFSPVGIFPLLISGANIKNFLNGARKALDICLNPDPIKNPALQSAAIIYESIKNKKVIYDLFLFNSDLENLGKWNRQLFGESLGKEGKGIAPSVSIGSTDLHSVGQLYLGGPKNIFTSFVSLRNIEDIKIPSFDIGFDGIVPELNNASILKVLNSIYKGTKTAYQKRGLPFVEIILDSINEEELGLFMQFKMIETMLLAKLIGVNAFDQPNVEDYKKHTKKMLLNN